MKKMLCSLFIALFFTLCLVPGIGLVIAGPSPAAANEAPAAAPRLTRYDGSMNPAFLTELNGYVSRGFFLRLEAITGWNGLCASLLRTSANDDVLLGPDGWLFYGASLDNITRGGQMTDAELWACARGLYLMQEYAASRGADFVFAVPCGKYTVYPEQAPQYVRLSDVSERERLNELLAAQGVHTAGLYEPFAASEETLYWQWDSHWNGKGAALAADTILGSLGMESEWFSGDFTESERHTGDLYAMLYPAGTATEAEYAPASGFTFTHTGDYHGYDDMVITTERAGEDGALLLMRDSSGRNLYPYLAERFGSAYITRANNYPLWRIPELGTTAVVAELCERNLSYLLKYPAVYPAPVREAVPDGARPVEASISWDTPADGPEGYVRLTGELTETPSGPVYVLSDGMVYEAIPGAASFTAWLPAAAETAEISVYILD